MSLISTIRFTGGASWCPLLFLSSIVLPNPAFYDVPGFVYTDHLTVLWINQWINQNISKHENKENKKKIEEMFEV